MHDESPKRRPRRRLAAVALAAAGIALLAAVASVLGGGETADISSEWPRPYDPAKPFNMLGVPGVSVEQRERAEDLLLRSLTEAHR
ncbi:MAG: hypothetical protein KJS90_08445, partial [Acidobacteria bacterium]|nr:hypothetical protein [Acidobacteriota bacterium]